MSPTTDPATAGSSQGWLVKPVSEEQLIGSVSAAVEGRRRDASVLIVEDDEDLAGVLRTLLAGHGLRVEHVSTVDDAVRRGRQLRPQVIVLDLELPDGDGTDVLAQLRSGDLDNTAVVVYTAADVMSDRVQAIDEATVFLTKAKVRPEELEDRVLRLMDAVTGKTETGPETRTTGPSGLQGAAGTAAESGPDVGPGVEPRPGVGPEGAGEPATGNPLGGSSESAPSVTAGRGGR
jgi:CheY-like chemotaxis protein